MDAEVDGVGPSAMVVEKDVVGPSAMVVDIRHIIARKEGGAWERTPQAVDIGARAREWRRMDAEVDE